MSLHKFCIQQISNFKTFNYSVPKGMAKRLEPIANANTDFRRPGVAYFKYLYVLNKITRHFIEFHFMRNDFDGYKGCKLNLETLTRIIGTKNGQTIKIINDLIAHGIIQRSGNYLIGSQSYNYAITHISNFSDESVTSLYKFKRISEKIIAKANEFYKNDSDDLLLYKEYLCKLNINGLDEYFNNCVNNNNNIELYPMLGELTSGQLQYVSVVKTNLVLQALSKINEGDIYVHRKDTSSRVYTSISMIKRETKPLLKYEGSSLIEFDIRNSQPLIASILIKNYWLRKGKDLPNDVIQYIKDCEKGVFYDYFMNLNNVSSSRRSEFKQKFFSQVYFSRVLPIEYDTKLKKQFKLKYPHCDEAITFIKGGIGSTDYNQFAIALQRKEAEIIFDQVNLPLLKAGVAAFNIYDSILCLPKDKDMVMERILNAFRQLNLKPTINVANYEENASIAAIMQSIEYNNHLKLKDYEKRLKRIKRRRVARKLCFTITHQNFVNVFCED